MDLSNQNVDYSSQKTTIIDSEHPLMKFKHLKNFFVMISLSLLRTKICLQFKIGFLSYSSGMKFMDSFKIQTPI